MQTHRPHPDTNEAIDRLSGNDALSAMLASHVTAIETVWEAMDSIERAATLVAGTFEAGGTVHYAAAGSSGLMALADACELPGTFGIPRNRIRICMAGGIPADGNLRGDTEDDAMAAMTDAGTVRPGDVAVTVSASGTTPYTLAFAGAAAFNGARVIGIANTAPSALLALSDVPVALHTAGEVVEGSTRLGAGTAQKVALNMISTRTGILLGHVHDGMMVNLDAENAKLRRRATDIVSRIARVPEDEARRALCKADHNTKFAALIASGIGAETAKRLLDRHRGRLGPSLREAARQQDTIE